MTETNDLKRKNLRNVTLFHKLRRSFDVASGIASDVIQLRDKPKLTDIAAMGIRMLTSLGDQFSGDIEDYFDGWYRISNITFIELIMDVIVRHPSQELGGVPGFSVIETTVFDQTIGWIKTQKDLETRLKNNSVSLNAGPSWYEGPWIHKNKIDETYIALGRALWEYYDTNKIVLGITHNIRNGDQLIIKADTTIDNSAHNSELGVEIYQQLKLFYDANVNRSIMLVGSPGTGKSTIMKLCANLFNKFTLRIHINELTSMPIETVIEAITILRPEVLLIDDFDRIQGHDRLLTALEEINSLVRIVIVSVNSISDIDSAVIRPGRIDKLIEVEKIDDKVVELILDNDNIPVEARDILRTWPVAYIHEFARRIKVLGIEETMREMVELRYRAEKINGSTKEKGLPSVDEMIKCLNSSDFKKNSDIEDDYD